jgi:DNA modification methylase
VSLPTPYYDKDGITIYHGDCRDILPHLPKVDLVLTDPPYGIGANKMTLGNGARKLPRGVHDWDAHPPDLSLITQLGKCIIWGGNYFGLCGQSKWLVWDKGTGGNDYADCELAWTNIGGVVRKFFKSWVGANAKERVDSDRFHPTQKPVQLMTWCMSFFPNAETILDPFMGSGTTLVAAKLLGKKAIGIELEEEYCKIAVERLAQGNLFSSEEPKQLEVEL